MDLETHTGHSTVTDYLRLLPSLPGDILDSRADPGPRRATALFHLSQMIHTSDLGRESIINMI